MKPKKILIGVTGSIAAYKICTLVSSLVKAGHEVQVILTRHAASFVSSLTLAALSHHEVFIDEFDGTHQEMIPHIELPRQADAFLIAPASGNFLAKAACGIADDLLSSAVLAAHCPVLAAPAMNVHMYENPATQANIATLKSRGWSIIEPQEGILACQDVGKGRMAEPEVLEQALMECLEAAEKEKKPVLAGLNILVSAGPTQECLDPVRFLSNHSSGKQGFAIAAAAASLGASVTLVAGPVSLPTPLGVKRIDVTTAIEMEQAVSAHFDQADWTIMAAAVADYRFLECAGHKLKKGADTLHIELVRNPDILAGLGLRKRADQLLCGFAMETENLLENARDKLESKNCDLLVANNLFTPGAGFQGDTNVVSLLLPDRTIELSLCTKEQLGHTILETLLAIQKGNLSHASLH